MNSMLENRKWTAFFSHTGSEIHNISARLGRYPDRVITNKAPGDRSINRDLLKRLKKDVVYVSAKPTVQDYARVILDDSVVTLHGWMRILPGKTCKQHDVYNLHPGLISKYPQLRGADPQKQVMCPNSTQTYKRVGCVIHRAVAQVDAGEILAECSCDNNYNSVDELTDKLHQMASDLWVEFLSTHAG